MARRAAPSATPVLGTAAGEEGLHPMQRYPGIDLGKVGQPGTMGRGQRDEIGRDETGGTKGGNGVGSRRNGRGKQGGGAGTAGEDSTILMLHSEAPVPFTLMPI